jgi:DNA-binding NarL/FixJ family response regulator
MRKENRLFFGNIAIAVANPLVRRAMSDHFRHRGADEIFHLEDWPGLHETVKHQTLGVMLVDDMLSEMATAPLIRDIRLGVLHAHPFPLVFMLAHQRGVKHLRELVDCGSDAIVLSPISITELFNKIDRFASGRKPFIITHDYIGPDRRSAPREGGNQPLTIETPNPLGADKESFQRALVAGEVALKAAQVECSLGQLAWTMRQGNTNNFGRLIVSLERLIKSTSHVLLKEAAEGLIGALRGQDMKSIVQWSQKVMAAKN